MHSPGKSLVGFMEEQAAIKYMRDVCAFGKDAPDAQLLQEWRAAVGKIGQPMGRAGKPTVSEIPREYEAYIEGLKAESWLEPKLKKSLKEATFKYVEIDQLLAMQFAVSTERSAHLCKALSQPPSMDQLMELCLPKTPAAPDLNFSRDGRSMHITTKNLSLRVANEGRMEVQTESGRQLHVGVHVDLPVPLLHVVRFQESCYLHNGFHRAYGARIAGATHLPCIFRDVEYSDDVGFGQQDTFSLKLLQSNNPPTLGHLTQGRAHDVQLRALTRVVQISWAEYTVDGI